MTAKLLKEVRRAEMRYWNLTLAEKHKQARPYWDLARKLYLELDQLGWKPYRGQVNWHGEDL